MTLVLTTINAFSVVQASDRLTTKARGKRFLGEHDPIANKTVIYLAYDGVMAISFAGLAYVGDEPTDEWIARQLAGRPHRRMPDGRIPAASFERLPKRTFNQAVWLLQKAIEAEPALAAPHGLEVAIGGWRIRRHRLVQTLLGIVKTNGGTVRIGDMRPRTNRFGSAFLSIGVEPDLTTLKAAIGAHPDPTTLLINPAIQSALLGDLIVKTSTTTPTVGSDVMAIEIPRWSPEGPARVIIRYTPGVAREAALVGGAVSPIPFPAAFWPWVVTPFGVCSPTVSSGGSGGSNHMGGWEFVRETTVARPQGSRSLYAESSIARPRPPR